MSMLKLPALTFHDLATKLTDDELHPAPNICMKDPERMLNGAVLSAKLGVRLPVNQGVHTHTHTHTHTHPPPPPPNWGRGPPPS